MYCPLGRERTAPMSRHSESENRNYNDTQRESAEYTADLLLGLRKTARRNDLSFLAHLLEMAFFEAHTIAKGVEPDMAASISSVRSVIPTDCRHGRLCQQVQAQ